MRQEQYTVIDYEELNSLIATRFNFPADYSVVIDLINDNRWQNDTVHAVSVERDNNYERSVMAEEIADVVAKGQIESSYRLGSVLRCLMEDGLIPWGNVLIQVSW